MSLLEITKNTIPCEVIDPATGSRKVTYMMRNGVDSETGKRVWLDRDGLGYVASLNPRHLVRADEFDEPVTEVERAVEQSEQAPPGYFGSLIWTRDGNQAGSGFIRHIGTAPDGRNLYENTIGKRFVTRMNGSGVEHLDVNGLDEGDDES